jgi:hypothetical protein
MASSRDTGSSLARYRIAPVSSIRPGISAGACASILNTLRGGRASSNF